VQFSYLTGIHLTHQQKFWHRSEIRIFAGNISILSTFVAKFKINFPGKEILPWERGCTVYTRPQDNLCIQDGGRVAGGQFIAIVS